MKAYSFSRTDSGSGNFPPPPPPPGSTPPPPPPASPNSPGHNSKEAVIPGMVSDMRLVGIFSIVCGALNCLTCIGALIGVPLIFAGMRLRESAEAFLNYSNTKDSSQLDTAIERQSRYFFIQKIFIIAALVIIVLEFIFLIILFSSGLFRQFDYQ
jgi:Family of unknown function (DUF5362)